jgi:hypothetical protein
MALTNWTDIFNSGCIFDLGIARPSLKIQNTPDDLGVPDTGAVKKAFTLGHLRLVDAKAFEDVNSAAQRASKAVIRHSMPFALIRGARYVPNSKLPKLLAELREARAEFDEAANKFMWAYEATKASQEPVIKAALADASRGLPGMADEAWRRVQANYPSAEEIRAAFSLTWTVYQLANANAQEAREEALNTAGQIKGVVRGMVEGLRADVAEKVACLIKLSENGGKLNGKSINAAGEVIARVRELNEAIGDNGLERELRSLEGILFDAKEERNASRLVSAFEATKAALAEGLEAAVASAEESLTGMGRRKIG